MLLITNLSLSEPVNYCHLCFDDCSGYLLLNACCLSYYHQLSGIETYFVAAFSFVNYDTVADDGEAVAIND